MFLAAKCGVRHSDRGLLTDGRPETIRRKVERLRENLDSASVVLTPAEIADIDARLDGMDFLVFGGQTSAK